MTPEPRTQITPHQLTLPFEGAGPPATPLLGETKQLGVRPRTIWRTLSASQRERTRQTLLHLAVALLREEGRADDPEQ